MEKILVSSEKVYRVLGFTESVTDCGCCGKTDLKGTYVMEHIESGEINYFGCVCAAKHQGYAKKEFTTKAKQKIKDNLTAAIKEYKNSPEYIEYNDSVNAHWNDPKNYDDLEARHHMLKNVWAPMKQKMEVRKVEIAAKYFINTNQLY